MKTVDGREQSTTRTPGNMTIRDKTSLSLRSMNSNGERQRWLCVVDTMESTLGASVQTTDIDTDKASKAVAEASMDKASKAVAEDTTSNLPLLPMKPTTNSPEMEPLYLWRKQISPCFPIV